MEKYISQYESGPKLELLSSSKLGFGSFFFFFIIMSINGHLFIVLYMCFYCFSECFFFFLNRIFLLKKAIY